MTSRIKSIFDRVLFSFHHYVTKKKKSDKKSRLSNDRRAQKRRKKKKLKKNLIKNLWYQYSNICTVFMSCPDFFSFFLRFFHEIKRINIIIYLFKSSNESLTHPYYIFNTTRKKRKLNKSFIFLSLFLYALKSFFCVVRCFFPTNNINIISHKTDCNIH